MPSFHVCRQVRCVTSVLDSHAALFADDMRLVKFPISFKKSKIMPNVRLVCVFGCIKYFLIANIALLPLHVGCALSASVRLGGTDGAFTAPRTRRRTRTCLNKI